jgi:hypothetical protein
VTPRPRKPVWSGGLTTPLAAVVRPEWRASALNGIKAIHTAIFATVGGAILLVVWDGVLQLPRRRTVVAGCLVVVESAIYASNNQVCPLTPLAEQLGARRGSVADIYLPDCLSRRIPVIGGSAMLAGLALNALARLRNARSNRPWVRMEVADPPASGHQEKASP